MHHLYYIYTVARGQKSLYRQISSIFDANGLEIKRVVRAADRKIIVTIITRRDPSGKISRITTSDRDGRQLSRITFSYSSQDVLVEKKFYDGNDRLIAINQWSYNKQGRLMRFFKSKAGENPFQQIFYSYDASGREKEIRTLGAGNQLVNRKTKHYSESNRLIEEIVFDAEQRIKVRMVPQYDENDRKISVHWYDKARHLQKKELFTYNGRILIEKTEIDLFKQSKTVRRFDEQGHLLANRWYELPDRLIRKVEKVWREDGHLSKQFEFEYTKQGEEYLVRLVDHYYE